METRKTKIYLCIVTVGNIGVHRREGQSKNYKKNNIMYLKKSNFAIYLGIAAVVGFGASFLFTSTSSQSSLLSGDISKASRYNNLKEDPAFSVVEEKLQNDADFYNLTENTYELIEARVDNLEDLTSRTIEICADIPEFKTAIKNVVSLNAKAYNTKQSIATATSGLKKLSEGKHAPEYEQASSNVFVGFQKIEYQLAIGKAFVDEAASYLDGKEGKECEAIAGLVAEWSIYCMQDAMLNKSDQDIAYWNDKAKEMVSESSAIALAYTPFVPGLSLDGTNGGLALDGTNGGLALDGTNGGLNLDGTNGGLALDGLVGELSLEKIASVISLEGVNGGLALDGTNGGLNLDGTNGGLALDGTNGGLALDGTNGGLNLDGVNGGLNLDGTNGGLNLDGINGGLNLDGINGGLNLDQVMGSVFMGLDPAETGLNLDKTGTDWQ